MSVNRCYSEKKPGFDVEARSLFSSLHDLLEIKNLTHVRYLCRYDAEGLTQETYEKAKGIVFSEPMADVCYDEDLYQELQFKLIKEIQNRFELN